MKTNSILARSTLPYTLFVVCLIGVVTSFYYKTNLITPAQSMSDWQGVWIKSNSLVKQDAIDQAIKKAEMGGFDALFVNILYEGFAYYNSNLLAKSPKIEKGFDPLLYLVTEAHRRGIEVHAWFMVGKFGDANEAPFFEQYREWSIQRPDGETIYWLNFNRPDVRSFLISVIMETVSQYKVDGLHFDYTRYPGDQWGYDPYSLQDFEDKTHIPSSLLRFKDLPAYGLLEGNPLKEPTTAKVMAYFSDNTPAITINQYGTGTVLLLNWDATERRIAVSSEILRNALHEFSNTKDPIGIFYSETNGKDYGFSSYSEVNQWINYLGWQTEEVDEYDSTTQPFPTVLIMPNIYKITETTALKLENFVYQGGNLIFIDGPTKSIHYKALQNITGMASKGRYFKLPTMIYPNGNHKWIPSQDKNADMKTYESWNLQWTEFRQDGINLFIQDVHKQVKDHYPQTMISVTITSDIEETGSRYMQDWEDWLRNDYIDFLIPRAYADNQQELESILQKWHIPLETYPTRIKMGLISYSGSNQSLQVKTPEAFIKEIDSLESAGLNGFLIFHLENMNDLQLNALKDHFLERQLES